MYTGNAHEDRLLGRIRTTPRRAGTINPYTGPMGSRTVFRGGEWVDISELEKRASASRPVVAPAKPSTAPAQIVAKAKQAEEARLRAEAEAKRIAAEAEAERLRREAEERAAWEAEQAELGARIMAAEQEAQRRAEEEAERVEAERLAVALKTMFNGKPSDPRVVTAPVNSVAGIVDLSRPKAKKRQRHDKRTHKAAAQQAAPAPAPVASAPAPIDCTNLAARIAALSEDAIAQVYATRRDLTWRFDRKAKLANAAKNPAGVRHVAAFVAACEGRGKS